MNGMNTVTVMGELHKDPKAISYKGEKGAYFTLAYTTKHKGKYRTEFFPVKVWGRQAPPVLEYCREGKPVMVNGALTQERWSGRDVLVIRASVVQFLPAPEREQNRDY